MGREAVVLVGGKGTRLRSVVSDVPKPLAPVGGKPFLDWLLLKLQHLGFTRVVLAAGYMADAFQEYIDNYTGTLELLLVVEEEPMGTGGAILLGLDLLEGNHGYAFNGDTIFDIDESALSSLEQFSGCGVLARSVDDCSRYGAMIFTEDGRVLKMSEKSCTGEGVINAGIYYISKDDIAEAGKKIGDSFSIETEAFPPLAVKNKLWMVVGEGYFIDIGIPEDYQKADEELPRLFNV